MPVTKNRRKNQKGDIRKSHARSHVNDGQSRKYTENRRKKGMFGFVPVGDDQYTSHDAEEERLRRLQIGQMAEMEKNGARL